MPPEHAANKVLRIGELTKAICDSFDDSRKATPLALTCMTVFQMLAPLIWEHVSGVEKLLSLIEGVRITRDCLNIDISIVLSKPADNKAPTRFNMYRSFVKQLQFPGPIGRTYDLPELSEILALFPSGQPLLPNLLTLMLTTPVHTDWSAAFISPCLYRCSLHEAEVDDYGLTYEDSHDLTLLGILAGRCPSLCSLVFPTASLRTQQPTPNIFTLSCHSSIAKIASLRELTINANWLRHGGLTKIGHLPRLQSLTIKFDRMTMLPDFVSPLPPDAFPVLCSLLIQNAQSPETLESVWEHFRTIKSLECLEMESSAALTETSGAPDRLMSKICEGRAPIRSLSFVHLRCNITRWTLLRQTDFASWLEPLSLLHLESLKIIMRDSHNFFHNPSTRLLPLPVFPFLKRLELCVIDFDFEGLRECIQYMPLLEYLETPLLVDSIHDTALERWHQPTRSLLRTLKIDLWNVWTRGWRTRLFIDQLDNGDGIKMAAFLSWLCPAVQLTMSLDATWLTRKQEIEFKQSCHIMRLVNRQIALFASRSAELGVWVGELNEDDCVITEEAWEDCLRVK